MIMLVVVEFLVELMFSMVVVEEEQDIPTGTGAGGLMVEEMVIQALVVVEKVIHTGGGGFTDGGNSSNEAGVLRWLTADATIGGTRTGLTDGGVQTDGSSSYSFYSWYRNITFS